MKEGDFIKKLFLVEVVKGNQLTNELVFAESADKALEVVAWEKYYQSNISKPGNSAPGVETK